MSTTLTVKGMTCDHCEQTVEEAIEDVAGVRTVKADRSAKQVTVHGDADPEALVTAVEDAGYDATGRD
jgi:copper chaperone CopZ